MRQSVGSVPQRVLSIVCSQARTWRGLIAVLALFVGFGALNVLGVPTLLPFDERAHLGYALRLADGELPTIESPLPREIFGRKGRGVRNFVWVANHPPLFYAVAAPFASLGLTTGGLERAVHYGRWVSLLLGAGALVFVHATAKLISSGNRRFALFGTLIAASIPSTIHISSLVHNDSAAILVSAATLYSAMLLALRGYSNLRVGALALCASMALLTRFTSAAVVAAAGGIACVGLLCLPGQRLRQRILRSASTAGLVGGSVLATSGWFYLRNLDLYGDMTGGAVLFEKFGRSPRGSAFHHVLDPHLWVQIYRDLWGRFGGGVRLTGLFTDIAWWILVVALLGIALRGYRFLRRRPSAWFSIRTLCMAGLAGAVALTLAAMFEFYSRGGTLHARYLLPVLWIVALMLAWGLSVFGRATMGVTTVLLCFVNLLVFSTFLGGLAAGKHGNKVALVEAIQAAGTSGAVWIVGLVLVVVAVSLHTILAEYTMELGPCETGRVNDAEGSPLPSTSASRLLDGRGQLGP